MAERQLQIQPKLDHWGNTGRGTSTQTAERIAFILEEQTERAVESQHSVSQALTKRFRAIVTQLQWLTEKHSSETELEVSPRRYVYASGSEIRYDETTSSELISYGSGGFVTVVGEMGALDILFPGLSAVGDFGVSGEYPNKLSYRMAKFNTYDSKKHVTSGDVECTRTQGAITLAGRHLPIETAQMTGDIHCGNTTIGINHTTCSGLPGALMVGFESITMPEFTTKSDSPSNSELAGLYDAMVNIPSFSRSGIGKQFGADRSLMHGLSVDVNNISSILSPFASFRVQPNGLIEYGWAIASIDNTSIPLPMRENQETLILELGFPLPTRIKDNPFYVWRDIPDIMLNGIPENLALT